MQKRTQLLLPLLSLVLVTIGEGLHARDVGVSGQRAQRRQLQAEPRSPVFWPDPSRSQSGWKVTKAALQYARAWALKPTSSCYEPPGPPSKVFSLTIATMTAGLSQTVRPAITMNRVLMALEQGLRYCEFRSSMDFIRSPKWSKILHAKEALYASKAVFFMDADALFTRFDVPLLRLLEELCGGRDAMFTTEFGKAAYRMTDEEVDKVQDSVALNSGAFYLKAGTWSLRFLDLVYLEAPLSHFWGHGPSGFHDQAGIMHFRSLHLKEWREHVRVVHFRHFNGWRRTWKPSGVVFHVAGGTKVTNKYDGIVLPYAQRFNNNSGLAKHFMCRGP
ncbi:hypothetical protein DUNSADRAFT_18637 [Dunaliella salina]|uniref:Nucleotide-diphospho-sugar transferase domain-containing protein n=1 Tax=Dunaliella salina TaxID=3046 RepID=A0ABQ7GYS7_DUNSA|nr:hypothetical protein DUNSADRAFT_18637 [Dunaliella salina]|eukprot:KAF5839759.1 hypothetical protein DUNSADRAFT_18637 [Dunaliella salina]